MLKPGDRAERYVVEGVAGRGRFATVYRVRHASLRTLHALKVLDTDDPVLAERLLREGRAQASLRHPNLVPVLDVLEVEGRPALLADFVPGPSLRDVLSGAPVAIREVERLFRGVLAGVEHAHAEGFVHRDLKPENVLLDGSGGAPVPRVTDFGLARTLADPGAGLTRTGEDFGVDGYTAPEVVRNARSADAPADLFSLGVLLYELACGAPPFPQAADYARLRAMARGDHVPLRSRRPELPERLARAAERAMDPDPSTRVATVSELRAILDRSVAHSSVARGPPVPVQASEPTATPATPPEGVWALVVDARGVGHAIEVVAVLDGGADAWTPQDHELGAIAAARSAAIAAIGRVGVAWQTRAYGASLHGSSLGLAIAVAARGARLGRPVPPGWAFTGAVGLDRRVGAVAGLPAKLRAAERAGVRFVAISEENVADVGAGVGVEVVPIGALGDLWARLGLADL